MMAMRVVLERTSQRLVAPAEQQRANHHRDQCAAKRERPKSRARGKFCPGENARSDAGTEEQRGSEEGRQGECLCPKWPVRIDVDHRRAKHRAHAEQSACSAEPAGTARELEERVRYA